MSSLIPIFAHVMTGVRATGSATVEVIKSRMLADVHAENARVYVAMNTLVKPNEPAQAYRLAARLARQVRPDGLIVQDLAMLDLARQAGFEGGLYLSTLANLTHPESLVQAKTRRRPRLHPAARTFHWMKSAPWARPAPKA